MPHDPTYWLAEQLKFLRNQLAALQSMPALANASSDGANGYLKISSDAVSGRPALEFHYTGGGGDVLGQVYQDVGGNIRITGGLQVSGTKNFVMSHPTEEGWILRHASTESPVNGVEYWGEGVLDAAGEAVVILPRYFEVLTKATNRIVQLTPIGNPGRLAYRRIKNGAFKVKGVAGQEFSWLVKAERASQEGDWPIDFLAEEEGEVAPPPGRPRRARRSSPMVDPDPVTLTPEALAELENPPAPEPEPEDPPIDPEPDPEASPEGSEASEPPSEPVPTF